MKYQELSEFFDHRVFLSIECDWYIVKCWRRKIIEWLPNRFHQYYVHGEFQDCTQWKENFNDCKRWSESADEEAAKRVIERERARIAERLKVRGYPDRSQAERYPNIDCRHTFPTTCGRGERRRQMIGISPCRTTWLMPPRTLCSGIMNAMNASINRLAWVIWSHTERKKP